MKTAYYTLYTREETADVAQASGGEDRLVRLARSPLPRRSVRRENNVIALADYLPAVEREEAVPVADVPAVAPRARTDHSLEHLIHLEWAACAAIICTALAACAALLF